MTALDTALDGVAAAPKKRNRDETPRAGARDLLEGADAIALELGFITAATPRGQVIKARRKVYRLADDGGWPIWRDSATGSVMSSRQALEDHIAAMAAAAVQRGARPTPAR